MNDIENLKTELAKAEARLADITKSLAKGGPGSGPHAGGGDSKSTENTHNQMAIRHGERAKQAEQNVKHFQDRARSANREGNTKAGARYSDNANRNRDMAVAHRIAADEHIGAARQISLGSPTAGAKTDEAFAATREAVRVSSEV